VHADNQTHRITKRSVEAELQHQEFESKRMAEEPLVLVLKLANTRQRILKLRPAISYLQDNIAYTIAKGNHNGTFEMRQQMQVTSLFFKKRLLKPETFDLEITGRPLDYSKLDPLPKDIEELDINLRIIVMP